MAVVAVVAPAGAVVAGRVVAVVLLAGPGHAVAVLPGGRVVGTVVSGDGLVMAEPPRIELSVVVPCVLGTTAVVPAGLTLVEVADGPGVVACVAGPVDAEMGDGLVVGAASSEPVDLEPSFELRRVVRLAPARLPVPVLSLSGIPTEPATSVVRTS